MDYSKIELDAPRGASIVEARDVAPVSGPDARAMAVHGAGLHSFGYCVDSAKTWHGFGMPFERGARIGAVLPKLDMGFDVESVPALYRDLDGRIAESADVHLNRRADKPATIFGAVGKGYPDISYKRAFQLVDELLAHGKETWYLDTIGSKDGGAHGFASIMMGDAAVAGADDVVRGNIMAATGFGGRYKLVIGYTMTRPQCVNTVCVAIKEASSGFVAKHTSGAVDRLEAYEKVTSGIVTAARDKVMLFRAMSRKTLARSEIQELLNTILPVQGSARQKASAEKQHSKVFENLDRRLYASTKGKLGTNAWTVFNAISHLAQWQSRFPGEKKAIKTYGTDADWTRRLEGEVMVGGRWYRSVFSPSDLVERAEQHISIVLS